MMRHLLETLFDTSRYETSIERDRARMVYIITILLMLFYALYIVFVPTGVVGSDTYLEMLPERTDVQFYVFSLYTIGALTLIATRRGWAEIAAWGPLMMWLTGAVISSAQGGFVNAISGVLLVGIILLGGLLKAERGLAVTTILALVVLALGINGRADLRPEQLPSYITSPGDLVDNNVTDFFTIVLELLGASLLIYLYLRYMRLSRSQGATEATEDRIMATRILGQIARQVARRGSLNELLAEIVDRINSGFDFTYHTQVFLIDEEGQSADLVASTGTVGQQLLEQGHSLGVGSLSVIGQVTFRGEPVIARAGSTDSIHHRNELLPETQVEAAFPLRVGDKIIGALDVQSAQKTAFVEEDVIAAFQALADSVSLAIDNVSQFEQAQARLEENERLVNETRDALREVERLNERLTGHAWSEYLRATRRDFGFDLDFDTNAIQRQGDWTSTLQEAVRTNHLVQDRKDGKQVIAVPLRVRGRVVGAMEFELNGSYNFSPEDLDLVQDVSERFGMAVDNARLVDESQRVAQREALVNQISSRLQSANNVENMLNEAARSLQDALHAKKVAIRLGIPSGDEANGQKG